MYFHSVHQDVLYKSGAFNDAMAKRNTKAKKRKAGKQMQEASQITQGVNTGSMTKAAKKPRIKALAN
jgi:hypothetical protein